MRFVGLSGMATTWVLTLAIAGAAAGCGSGNSETETPSPSPASSSATGSPLTERPLTSLDLPVSIVVTLPVFEDFVRQAGGEHAEVFSVVPEGVDPRTYELTAADIEHVAGATFLYVNGLGLDDHLHRAFEQHMGERAYLVPFGPNVRSPTVSGAYADDAGDEAHLWLDPDLAAVYVAIVADEFVIYDEVNRSFYDGRFRAAIDDLHAFGAELASDLDAIPEDRRTIVARSEAVTHIARRFGLGLEGTALTGDTQESLDHTVQRLAQLVEDQGLPAVFGEFGHDNFLIQEVADTTGVEMCTLYTDIADGSLESYEDLMRANAAELIRCLG